MELTFDQKILLFMLVIIVVNPWPGVSGLIVVNTTVSSCDGTKVHIPFSVDLQNGSIIEGSESWFHEETVIATRSEGKFLPGTNYTSRLHSYLTYGLTLDNVTDADKGIYLFVFSYRSTSQEGLKTATATLTVKVTPSENCVPSYRQDGASAICELNSATNCGSPRLVPIWTNTSGNSFTVINPGKYTCCATGSILSDCYRGSSSFCRTFDVAVQTTLVQRTMAFTFADIFKTVSVTSKTTTPFVTSKTTTPFGSPAVGVVGGEVNINITISDRSINTGRELRDPNGVILLLFNPRTVNAAYFDPNVKYTGNIPGGFVSFTLSKLTIQSAGIYRYTISKGIIGNVIAGEHYLVIAGASSTSSINPSATIKNTASDADIKVIVPAVVIPCGLVIIGAIILLVVWCVRRRAGKNVPKSQDGIRIKYRDKNKDNWKL